jgi:hypothetical protein
MKCGMYGEEKKCTQENNIKIDLNEIGQTNVDWITVAQNVSKWRTAVNTVMELWAP